MQEKRERINEEFDFLDSRTINLNLEDYEKLKPIISKIKEDCDNYFLTFRNNRLTIYYRGLFLLDIKIKNKKMYVSLRKESSTETNEVILANNKDYLTKLKEAGLIINDKIIDIEVDAKENVDFINIGATWIDNYLQDKVNEKTIQSDISCKYQNINDNLICIDTEYVEKFSNGKTIKEESNVKGRYDFIFLKKENSEKENSKFKVLFGELKANKAACTDYTTGILNHVNDMNAFLESYKNNEYGTQDKIRNSILFALKTKYKLGLIFEIKEDAIDFSNPKFALIFAKSRKMKSLPIIKEQLGELITEEIETARRSNNLQDKIKMDNNPIKIDNELIPKYKITKENYTKVIDMVSKNEIYIFNNKTKQLDEIKL